MELMFTWNLCFICDGEIVQQRRIIVAAVKLSLFMKLASGFLQMGGIEPKDIIKMVTHNAAKMLGILDELGTLEVGKLADMVLLEKNPLVDIRNTLTIHSVFRQGNLQTRIKRN